MNTAISAFLGIVFISCVGKLLLACADTSNGSKNNDRSIAIA